MNNIISFFEESYGYSPTATAKAPGRGNLIGEHTDYNMGFIMPFALKQSAKIAIAINKDAPMGELRFISTYDKKMLQAQASQKPQEKWIDYLVGSIQIFAQEKNIAIPALDIALDSDVPLGAGVSSSAALEVCMLRALRTLLKIELSDLDIAILARKAENEYVGMPCGIMDQMASSICQYGEVLFIDTQDLSFEHVKIPEGYTITVVPSGYSHALVDGAYETIHKQCMDAAKALGVKSLRKVHVDELDRVMAIAEPLNRRAKHIITENQRVLDMKQALADKDMATIGKIITEGHISERDDFEITIAETDALVEDMIKCGALGARQIGGGFGGSCIALVKTKDIDNWWQQVHNLHPKSSLI